VKVAWRTQVGCVLCFMIPQSGHTYLRRGREGEAVVYD
jgi:hypothetical protein